MEFPGGGTPIGVNPSYSNLRQAARDGIWQVGGAEGWEIASWRREDFSNCCRPS